MTKAPIALQEDQPAAPLPAVNRSGSWLIASSHRATRSTGCRQAVELVGATGRNHLADHGREQGRRVLPAYQVKALECLVDEIERVSGIGKRPLRLGR